MRSEVVPAATALAVVVWCFYTAEMAQNASDRVVVFGTDHSPWVQTVLVAFEDSGVPYELRPFPVSLREFFRSGLVMPSCRWPDGTVTRDSFAILEELCRRRGHSKMRADDLEMQSRLEHVFLSYVLGRAGSGRRLKFIDGWSRKRDQPTRATSTALRAVLCLYFFVLILVGQRRLLKNGIPLFQGDSLRRALSRWSERLLESDYLGGNRPSAADYGLLGQIQCMVSGLTDETLPVLRDFPPICRWLERMHGRLGAYDRLYSKRVLDHEVVVSSSSSAQRALFYTVLVLSLIVFPLTGPVLIFAFLRRGSNPARTGARLRGS